MGCMCAECKYAKIVRDNHEKLIVICVCRESDNFLHELEIACDNCDFGFVAVSEKEGRRKNDRRPSGNG